MVVQHMCHCDSLADLPAASEGQEEELARMASAVHQLLVGVGEDPSREGLVDTPRRVAKAWLDMTRGYRQECKSAFGTALFHEPIVASGSDGLVIVRDITFAALSERTLLPFHGRCHIAYVPAHGVVLGLSKLARVTKCLAARLQTQEQFTDRLLEVVQCEVQAKGVAAVVQAFHLGTCAAPAAQLSSGATGCFQDPAQGHLQEFVTLLRLGGRAAPAASGFGSTAAAAAAAAAAGAQGAAEQPQQQQQLQQQQQEPQQLAAADAEVATVSSTSSMVAAADALLLSVGEDPTRKGLKGSAARYVSWLRSATAGYRMQLLSSGAGAVEAAAAAGAAAGGAAAVEQLGPPTPDDHSSDPSDASSDHMSADSPPCCAAEPAEGGGCSCSGSLGQAADGQPHHQQQQQQLPQQPQPQAAEGVQTFSAQFSSQCEHHLLPFYGRLKVAYQLPAGGAVGGGRSDGGASASSRAQHQQQLGRIVDMFSRRLQVQERLTHQVADAAAAALGASAVLVVVESAHMCMVARGVEKHASTTLSTAARGAWAVDAAARGAALGALLEQQPQPHR